MKKSNRLLHHLVKFIPLYIIGILTLLGVDIIQLFIPRLVAGIIDGIKRGGFTINDILVYVVKLAVISLMIFAGRAVWRFFIFGPSRKIEDNLRCDLFAHLEKLSQNFYNKNKTGELMAHFTNDLSAVRMAIGPGLMMAIDAVVMTALIILNMIVFVNLKLTLLAVLPLPVIGIGGIFFGKAMTIRFREKQEAFAKMTDYTQEAFNGIRVIKAFVQEKRYLAEFLKANRDNYDRNIRLARIYSIAFPLVEFIAGLSFLITLVFGGYLAVINLLSLGKFIAFNQFLGMLIWPMIAMGWCINIFSQGLSSHRRIQKIFGEKPEIVDRQDIKMAAIGAGKIELKNLSFRYDGAADAVLKKISLVVNAGETLGITGKTGSGKTTLINLLARLYNPPEKSVLIDGTDIYDIPIVQLRDILKIVTQEPVLFSTTIRENIAFGHEMPDDGKLFAAADDASIHETIADFPDKYETVIGERGITLSGGQKQRVSIARALLKDPGILILDDSFSSVDAGTENRILESIRRLRKGKTTIIIAHRITAIQSADNIIFLENGAVKEQGTHKELLKRKSAYYELYQKQLIEKKME